MSSTPGNGTSCVLFLRRVRGILAAVLVLSVPVVAVSALTSSTGIPAVSVAASDDAVTGGFRLVNAPAEQVAAKDTATENGDAVLLLQNWTETGGPGGGGGTHGGGGSPGK
jgi:hypothetical protein